MKKQWTILLIVTMAFMCVGCDKAIINPTNHAHKEPVIEDGSVYSLRLKEIFGGSGQDYQENEVNEEGE